jgi:hypothetical protein
VSDRTLGIRRVDLVQGEAGIYGPGDGVTWPATTSGRIELIGTDVVPCADPTPTEFSERTSAVCDPMAWSRLGDSYQSNGRFSLTSYYRSGALVRRRSGAA